MLGALFGFDTDGHLDFDDGVARQSADADCGAYVFASFAEDLHEEIGGAVDDGGGIFKAGDGIDVAVNGDDLGDRVEVAEIALEDGELGEGAGAGGVVAVGDAAIESDGAGHDAGAVGRDDAGEVNEWTDPFGGKIVTARRGRSRERDAEF